MSKKIAEPGSYSPHDIRASALLILKRYLLRRSILCMCCRDRDSTFETESGAFYSFLSMLVVLGLG